MKTTIYKCDGARCDAIKRETNHWWMVQEFTDIDGRPRLNLQPWDEKLADSQSLKHYCGEGCVAKRVSEFVSSPTKIGP